MADAVASQILIDGPRNVVAKFTNISDGTGESAVLKVDVSALSGTPDRVRIDKIHFTTSGMGVRILWDATTDVTAFVIGADQTGWLEFKRFGGLTNNAGTGITGDILFTTFGHSSGDTYSIILEMTKG